MFFKIILFVTVFLQYAILVPHGFAENTLVSLENNQDFLSIKEISSRFFRGQKTKICSYKEKSKKWKNKQVQAVAYCQSNTFFELNFARNHTASSEMIICSPLQMFYRVSDKVWIPAYELCDGDVLLCKNQVTTQLQSKKHVHDPITLYVIEVKKHHTFAVGHQKILTHNMFIPIATTIGMSIPFDIILGAGSFGCMFGLVTFCCSIAVAGIAAAIAYQCGKEKYTEFSLKCENVGHYEIRPMYDGAGCGGIVPDLGCTHKATVEDILLGTTPGQKTRGKSIQYVKPGSYEDALKDFEDLGLSNVQDLPGKEGKRGTLSDGGEVNVRLKSKDGRPTIEVQPVEDSGDKKIKIRYGDKQCDNKSLRR